VIRVIYTNETINEYKILVVKSHGKVQLTSDMKGFEDVCCAAVIRMYVSVIKMTKCMSTISKDTYVYILKLPMRVLFKL
jgi:hypothetical protein